SGPSPSRSSSPCSPRSCSATPNAPPPSTPPTPPRACCPTYPRAGRAPGATDPYQQAPTTAAGTAPTPTAAAWRTTRGSAPDAHPEGAQRDPAPAHHHDPHHRPGRRVRVDGRGRRPRRPRAPRMDGPQRGTPRPHPRRGEGDPTRQLARPTPLPPVARTTPRTTKPPTSAA